MLCLYKHVGQKLTHIKIKEIYPKGVGKKDRKEKKKGNVHLFESFLRVLWPHSYTLPEMLGSNWAIFCSFVLHNSVSLEIWYYAPLTDGRKKER